MTVITNPYFTEVVQAIEDELAHHGYGLLLGDSHDDPERELRLLHYLHQRRVDAWLPQETPGKRRRAWLTRSRRSHSDTP